MATMQQFGIIPALLITLGGLLALRNVEGELVQRRLLFYALGVGALLMGVLFVAFQLTPQGDNRPFFQASRLLIASLVGVLTLIVLHLRGLKEMGRRGKLLALLLIVGMAAAGWLLAQNPRFGFAYQAGTGVAALVIGWVVGRRFRRTAVFLGLLLLLGLFFFNLALTNPEMMGRERPSQWLIILLQLIYFALPGLFAVIPAALLANGWQQWRTDSSPRAMRGLLAVGLAVIMLGYLIYSIFWASVWDQTSDGLGGLFLSEPAALAAVGAGMVMALTLSGRGRVVGLLFAALVPLLLYQAFNQGWDVSYHDITERRAARIIQALDGYRQREGVYPATLDALTPRDVLFVRGPVIFAGEEWCYQGGDDFYRLGAVYREFFSSPISLRIYAAEGEPVGEWACDRRLVEMKERHFEFGEDEMMQPPQPTPLPPSEVAVPRQRLASLLPGEGAVWGSWSPDGAYFLLGKQENGGVTLAFLDTASGDLCPADGAAFSFEPWTASLWEQHAWLPDGRVVVVDSAGTAAALTPCAADGAVLLADAPPGVTQIIARDEVSGRSLFKSADAFWIFDGETMGWRQVAEATPVPFEQHWDRAAWLPGGERLAISRMNGRGGQGGSTLFVIDGTTGAVQISLPLAYASNQSAPGIDWLGPETLLMYIGGPLSLLDLSVDPPQFTDVLVEIFNLDLKFPEELSGHSWHVDGDGRGYYLTVFANHPRNQSLYLYDSATDEVAVFDHDQHTLLLFPDGHMERMERFEAEPAFNDVYELVQWGTERPSRTLVIEGHAPRNYAHLSIAYLPDTSRLAVASSQGVSLHSFPDGEMTAFWELEGPGFAPFLQAAPASSALVVIRDNGGLYLIPLP